MSNMTYGGTPRPCGCKGCRVCLLCEKYVVNFKKYDLPRENGSFVYCPHCNKAWPGWDMDNYYEHPIHKGTPIDYSGVYIDLNFLTEDEESILLKNIDKESWCLSQSGRRKQNFGPKCNFNKRKLQVGDFNGFPQFSKIVIDKFNNVPILKGFQTIEQCFLEYRPETGASIDPHVDDCWIWGERIVTVNLLSDSVLTMTFNNQLHKYNLDCVKGYSCSVESVTDINCSEQGLNDFQSKHSIVRIPMPRRSLLVLYGPSRYAWEHRVLREDIVERRVCIAYREFTPPYLKDGSKFNLSKPILEKANMFF